MFCSLEKKRPRALCSEERRTTQKDTKAVGFVVKRAQRAVSAPAHPGRRNSRSTMSHSIGGDCSATTQSLEEIAKQRLQFPQNHAGLVPSHAFSHAWHSIVCMRSLRASIPPIPPPVSFKQTLMRMKCEHRTVETSRDCVHSPGVGETREVIGRFLNSEGMESENETSCPSRFATV
jgi:hypothetical protein